MHPWLVSIRSSTETSLIHLTQTTAAGLARKVSSYVRDRLTALTRRLGRSGIDQEETPGIFLLMTITWSCRYGWKHVNIDEYIPNGWECDSCQCACYMSTDDDDWVKEFLDSYD